MFFAEITKKEHEGYYAVIKTSPMFEMSFTGIATYKLLCEAVNNILAIRLPRYKSLLWSQKNHTRYAYVDATQYLGEGRGCSVSLKEMESGHAPKWN